MADPTNGAAPKIKLPITTSTVLAAGSAGAAAGVGPQLVKPIVEWGCDIARWAAPGFPLPSPDGNWSIACLICGGVAFLATLFLRPHRADRRAGDADDLG